MQGICMLVLISVVMLQLGRYCCRCIGVRVRWLIGRMWEVWESGQ